MIFLILLLEVFSPAGWLFHVRTWNNRALAGQEALSAEQYPEAVAHFRYALDTLGLPSEAANLNLAHALLRTGKVTQARDRYRALQNSPSLTIRAIALNQLGVLEAMSGQPASQWFRQALQADPLLQEARYNFELALRMEPEEPEHSPFDEPETPPGGVPPEEATQQKAGLKSEQQQGRQGGKGNTPLASAGTQKTAGWKDQSEDEAEPEAEPEGKDKVDKGDMRVDHEQLNRMQLTEEQARQLLDALRRQEIQYLQQMHKPAENQRTFKKPY